ncbi:MAG: hypothetical protein B6I18_06295 [Bacteroidetes bacterium 4572_112]|nr:MAG: hypothetical protein B6I18_06295 [Bacteroidetes bacterium 4572_112]
MNFRRLIIFSLIFTLALGSISCRRMIIKHKRRKDAREMEKERKRKEKEATAKYQDKIKYQASIQTPETRKRMEAQYKKSERYHSHKKEFFLKRWWKSIFGPKRRTGSPNNS